MDDNIEPALSPDQTPKVDSAKPGVAAGSQSGATKPGKIADEIGTGEHAKDSFIWMTLKYCFYLGALFSVCIMIAFFHFSFDKDDPNKIDIVAALKDVWSIFTPILTLALGYAFGKRDRGE